MWYLKKNIIAKFSRLKLYVFCGSNLYVTIRLDLVTIICLAWIAEAVHSFQCVDNNGDNKDWWFIYKLPSGYLYSYFDETTVDNELIVYLDSDLDEQDSAAGKTLSPLLSNKENYNFAAYNDEPPDGFVVPRHH